MIETAPQPDDHLVFVAAWQENLAGRALPRDFSDMAWLTIGAPAGRRSEKCRVGTRL